MSLAAIACSHCGDDYAREYWTAGPERDPFVCKSCRRDTNPDAADAPRWVPSAHADSGATADEVKHPAMLVTPARKQCRVCRGEYDGLIFGSPPVQGSPLPFGICDACGVADDRATALATARVVPYAVTPSR